MKKSKFYKEMFFTYFIIVAVITIISFLVMLNKVNKLNSVKIDTQNQMILEQVKERVDTKIIIADKVRNQIVLDNEVFKFCLKKKTDYHTITNVFNMLKKNYGAFYATGFDIAVTKQSLDLIISPDETLKTERYFRERNIDLKREEIFEIFNKRKTTEYLTVNNVNDEGVQTLTLINVAKINNEKLMVIISFTEKDLLPSNLSDDLGAVFIKNDDKIVTHSPIHGMGFDSESLEDMLLKDSTTLEKDYKVYTTDSNVLTWEFIYVIPRGNDYIKMKGIVQETIFIYIGLLIVAFFVVSLITKHLYKPIGEVVVSLNDYAQQGDENEFQFISQVTERMNETNIQLKSIINRNRLPLKEKFLRDILSGIMPNELFEKNLEKYEMVQYADQPVTIALFELNNVDELTESMSKEGKIQLIEEIITLMKEQLDLSFENEIIDLNSKRLALIIFEENQEKIKKSLKLLLYEIEVNLEISMISSVGATVQGLQHSDRSYSEASQLLEYKNLFVEKMVITEDDVQKLKNDHYYYPLEMEQKIIDSVLNSDIKNLQSILKVIVAENLYTRKLSKELINQLIFSLTATSNRILQQCNKTPEDFFEEGYIVYLELKTYSDLKDLEEKIKFLFNSMLEKISGESRMKEYNMADLLVEFIHDNYSKDISLTDIAEHFNLSPSYISTLFKNMNTKNFKDYLNNYRVNQAKNILDGQPNIKIADLAGQVGFNNVNSFIRTFKKYEGVSPGKYAKNQ